MIKARAGNLVILGLSHENLRRLKDGRPMKFALGDLDAELQFLIFAGETEAKIMEMFRELIGPDTRVIDHTEPTP